MSESLILYANMATEEITKKLYKALTDQDLSHAGKKALVHNAVYNAFLDGHELALETVIMKQVDPKFEDPQ